MPQHRQSLSYFARLIPLLVLALLLPTGCARDQQSAAAMQAAKGTPIVRVRLLSGQSQVAIAATAPPMVKVGATAAPRRLSVAPNAPVNVTHAASGWSMGNVLVGQGELTVEPPVQHHLTVNGTPYRGSVRLVPTGAGRFDVINDVDIDSYLKSVVSKELLRNWHIEAFKAQAIAARTYALYEVATAGKGRHWDVWPDVRSQAYGGLDAETDKSVEAVEATTGVVVAWGQTRGQEKIFKAYFSACCGGVGQSALDAFGDPYFPPLDAKNVGTLCSESPRFNWSTITLSKPELTRRIRYWGQRKGRAEQNIATVTRIDVQARNRYGRPVRFLVTDARGARYSLAGEELRWAVNSLGSDKTLLSSYFNPVDAGDSIRFTDGHGFGHGVGLCQWCAQVRATRGQRHEDIVLLAYPGARLVRAY